jgi:transposase-like protein
VFSIDGTFLTGKYEGTLLIAIGIDADDHLLPKAFALVKKENRASWSWFLRLLRVHVVGPGRPICVLSDRHAGILGAIRENIPGHGPVHHQWCTHHLADNLMRKGTNKDNFELFEEVCRQLEVQKFEEKLEDLKSKKTAEGRAWISRLMPELEKWSRLMI